MSFRCVADTQATADALIQELQTIMDSFAPTTPPTSRFGKHLSDQPIGDIVVRFFRNFVTAADMIAAKASVVSKLSEIAYATKIASAEYLSHDCYFDGTPCAPWAVMA